MTHPGNGLYFSGFQIWQEEDNIKWTKNILGHRVLFLGDCSGSLYPGGVLNTSRDNNKRRRHARKIWQH